MAQIDRFIDFMVKQQGERFVVQSGKQCIIQRPSGPMPVQQQLNSQQIESMVQEIAPSSVQPQLTESGTVRFSYESTAGKFDIAVERSDGNLQLTIASPKAQQSTAPAPPAPPVALPAPPTTAPAPPAPPSAPRVSADGGKAIEHMDELFLLLKEMDGSDIHISSNRRPYSRVQGRIRPLEQYKVNSHDELKKILWQIMPERNQREWDERHDTDFAYELPGIARFRCNIYRDRHGIGGVFRLIPSDVWTVEQMGLPKAMVDLCTLSKGIVIITGPTGSGKTTTLGALLDHVNKVRNDHVITIEDPIEFVHENINCIIHQRQVHEHTNSFATALRAALREDPDVILVGEMRDLETAELAIHCAETGHLVFATLHTSSAPSTVDRVIDQFPPEQQEQIRVMLSSSLKGVISQVLVHTIDGRRAPAFEILLVDSACGNLIREGKTYQLVSIMQVGKGRGCQTMNDALMTLVKEGRVEPKEAYFRAHDKVGMKQALETEGISLDVAPSELE